MTKRRTHHKGQRGLRASLALVVALFVAGCAGTPTVDLTQVAVPTNNQGFTGQGTGYPGPTPQEMGYPAPTDVPPTPVGAVPFVLARPIVEGAVTVTGQGRPGVPILLQDVTFMGAAIAETTVDADGNFSFAVPPLERNHRLGITIGDLTGTEWVPEDFLSQAYWGPGAQQLPQVGFYLDTDLVKEP